MGYFATVATADVFSNLSSLVTQVTVEQVAAAAGTLLRASNRTIGWFDPIED
jgi:hypothetical protein